MEIIMVTFIGLILIIYQNFKEIFINKIDTDLIKSITIINSDKVFYLNLQETLG